GDSGGGVVERTPQGFVIQGIVSWGIGCNRHNFPSAYTRVSSYVNFIHQNTKYATCTYPLDMYYRAILSVVLYFSSTAEGYLRIYLPQPQFVYPGVPRINETNESHSEIHWNQLESADDNSDDRNGLYSEIQWNQSESDEVVSADRNGDYSEIQYPESGDVVSGDRNDVYSEIQYCGQTFSSVTSERIINGVQSKPQEFPWMAKLILNTYFFCGGTLIATNYVLTAGHCVASHLNGSSFLPISQRGNVKNFRILRPDNLKVYFGVMKFKDPDPPVQSQVLEIILHPLYDVFSTHGYELQTNDVALLRIEPVVFSQAILPVCLPNQGDAVLDGTLLTVAGWGLIQEGDPEQGRQALNPKILMKTTMRKISWRECRENPLSGPYLDPENDLTEDHIMCMKGENTDACQGDSGGGVVERTPQGFVIQGIVSWGIGCNRKNFPSAYTRVSSYVNFIRQNTQDASYLPRKS
ncbi:hypothetical protein GE061_011206, partial [Apolygus lucorum]